MIEVFLRRLVVAAVEEGVGFQQKNELDVDPSVTAVIKDSWLSKQSALTFQERAKEANAVSLKVEVKVERKIFQDVQGWFY